MSNEGFLKFVRNDTEKDLVTVIQEETADNLTQSEADTLYLGKTEKASSASTADAVAWTGVSGKPSFATVATTGSYNDLKNKPSIPSNPNAYVTQTWKSGANWYRRWSDGFIEQGGETENAFVGSGSVVTLPTAFTTTNYLVLAMSKEKSNSTSDSAFTASIRNNINFMLYNNNGSELKTSWYACGY